MNTFSAAASQGGKTSMQILVVEDNRDTRDMVCELLRLLGHEPLGVANAEQASSEVESRAFDILFTDISLPGMSGIELAKKLAVSHPSIRIILASGYYVDKNNIAEFDCEILVKPYDLEQLQAALQRAGNMS